MQRRKSLTSTLISFLESRNVRAQLLSIQHLADLEAEIIDRKTSGELDLSFSDQWLTHFTFKPSDSLAGAASILITAVAQPHQRVTFHRHGKAVPFIIPPIYDYSTNQLVQSALDEVLTPLGHHYETAFLPAKVLAVRSGLARYGRNNITYIEGFGSFHRLKPFFTTVPVEEDSWVEAQHMAECSTCVACRKSCPTGAIGDERFLIHAQRCLTNFNELPGDFPPWLDPSLHHCIVGCMHCQWACPKNAPFRNWIEDRAFFDESETEMLLQGTPRESLGVSIFKKLEKTGLVEYLEWLPRNLGVLFSKHSG